MEIKQVFVVGAGAMGAGIAQLIAERGCQVRLNDIDGDRLEAALAGMERAWRRAVEKGKMSGEELEAARGRISIHRDLEQAAGCDLVIEAAAERLEVKHQIFQALDRVCGAETIFATNSSSLSITGIGSVLSRPHAFAGMHFFNPVSSMKLVELIAGLGTAPETMDALQAFGTSLGKRVVRVKDGPGFLVNRMLVMTLNEAAELLDQGYGSVEDIDQSMVYGCGHPMGPLTLMDMVGVDIVEAVMETLYAELGDSKYRPSLLLKKMVRSGFLGQKAGGGFYLYDGPEGKRPNPRLVDGIRA